MGEDRSDQARVMHRRQRHEVHAVGKLLDDVRRELEAQPCLADAARTGQREETRAPQQALCLGDVPVAADEAGQLRRQVVRRRVERAQGGKLVRHAGDHELVEPLGARQVLQPVGSEVAQRLAVGQVLFDEGAGGLRDDDLAAMSGRGHTRGVVDVEADVLVAHERRLARVQAHAHTKRHALRPLMLRKPGLRGGGRAARVDSALEDAEERVALGAKLPPAAPGESRTQDLVVRRLRLDVAVADLLHEARRALDVGEEERDRPGRERQLTDWVRAALRTGSR